MKEFYRHFQDFITPAGLAFFQSDWDDSLTDFFHKTLGKLFGVSIVFQTVGNLNFFHRYE